jgi:hypothetical protein
MKKSQWAYSRFLCREEFTTETQRRKRLHRERISFFCSRKKDNLPLCNLFLLCVSVVNSSLHRKREYAQHRSFFLLEIVISLVLIGIFAFGFLGSGLKYVSLERKALLELEFEMQRDLVRMEAIEKLWKEEETKEPVSFDKTLKTELGGKKYTSLFRLKGQTKKFDEHFDLVLEEGSRKHHFLIK